MHRFFGASPRTHQSDAEHSHRGKDPASPQEAAADNVAVGAAIDRLRDTSDLCAKREQHLARRIAEEVEAARKYGAAGRQRDAILALKRKKILEKEMESLSAGKLSLFQEEQTLSALKFTSLVHDAHKVGIAAIQREISKVKGVDGVEKVQDTLEDLLADASDVMGAGNRVVGQAADLDDDELLEELEQMELEGVTDQLTRLDTGTSTTAGSSSDPVFANAPTSKPTSAREIEKEREERELLEELKSTMTMKVEAPMSMPMMAVCY